MLCVMMLILIAANKKHPEIRYKFYLWRQRLNILHVEITTFGIGLAVQLRQSKSKGDSYPTLIGLLKT